MHSEAQELYSTGCITESEYNYMLECEAQEQKIAAMLPKLNRQERRKERRLEKQRKFEQYKAKQAAKAAAAAQEQVSIIPMQPVVIEPITVSEESLVNICFRVHQDGIEANATISAKDAITYNGQFKGNHFDLAEEAQTIAGVLFAAIRRAKIAKNGYFLEFFLNEEKQKVQHQFQGKLHFNHIADVTFTLLEILAAKFNGDKKSLITGKVTQTMPVQQVMKEINLTTTNLSLSHVHYALDRRRKKAKMEDRATRRQIDVETFGEAFVLAREARAKELREVAAAKKKEAAKLAAIKVQQEAAAKAKHAEYLASLKG